MKNKVSSQSKIRLFLGIFAAIACLAGSAQIVVAEAGNEGGIGGGACAGSSYTGTVYWDTCFGANWKYYPTTSDVVVISPSPGSYVAGGTITGCGKYGGYYRLGLIKFNPQTGAAYATQEGLVQNNTLRPYGGRTTFSTQGGGVSLSAAQSYFNVALANNATNGLPWSQVSWFCYDKTWSGEEATEPDDPAPPSGTTTNYTGHFYSTSTVEIPAQNGDVSTHSLTSNQDGTATVKLSTDAASFQATFHHDLYYENDISPGGSDTFPDISTNWSITGTGANGSGTYKTNGKSNANTEVGRTTVTIPLSPGETVTVCHTVNYNPKTIYFSRHDEYRTETDYSQPIYEWSDYYQQNIFTGNYGTKSVWDHYRYEYSGSSGSGSSEACVTVTRPSDPSGSGPSNPSGTTSSDVLFTGEDANVGWETSVTSHGTRRNVAAQAIIYQVPATVDYYNGITTGTDRYRGGDTCTYYQGKSTVDYCSSLYSETYNTGDAEVYNGFDRRASVIVPDTVGYKYCNSFGYKFEYWYAYNTGSGDQWTHDSSRDYWYVYNAACRPIAKKPSTAIWNNSFLTEGGVKTSISHRYNPANMGSLTSDGSGRRLYGSWAEYLDVVNGTVNGFASGSALALGSLNSDIYNNSPLTIANQNGSLGHSGVRASTSLRTRLDTYLKNQAAPLGDTISGGGWQNITDTRIYHRSGNLNINANITLNANAPYANIYQLPQVILFVDGDVNISSSVTQIDAWIIATGTINTCSDFRSRTTEADAINRRSDVCTSQLVFNGPVMAKRLTLNRSFGSDPGITYRQGTFGAASDRQTPAEVFNYRADAYLWAYAQAGRYDSSYTETYTRELAPRY